MVLPPASQFYDYQWEWPAAWLCKEHYKHADAVRYCLYEVNTQILTLRMIYIGWARERARTPVKKRGSQANKLISSQIN